MFSNPTTYTQTFKKPMKTYVALTLVLKREKKGDFGAVFLASSTGGGGSGFAAASKVAAFEKSTFFYQNGREENTNITYEVFTNKR